MTFITANTWMQVENIRKPENTEFSIILIVFSHRKRELSGVEKT
jgi:hypothetical protein